MTDLKAKPYADRDYEAVAALDVDFTAPVHNATVDNLSGSVRAMNAVLVDETGLSTELRRLTPQYLKARERFEERDTPTAQAAAEYTKVSSALVHVLVAIGAYNTDEEANSAVEALTFPGGADMLVARWADREHVLDELDHGAISNIAETVIERVAEGRNLDNLGMWELADPYLNRGEL
jgi:hypothetical protein